MTKQDSKRAELALRREIIATCLAMNASGLNQGTSGNVSARWGSSLLITPSGVPYEELTPKDIVAMPLDRDDGGYLGKLAPSSEWQFHHDILRARPDVGAIVHTHSIHATALAICGEEIPAVHYMIAAAGGPTIRVAPYATYGTPELSRHALAALEGRSACLLANHGVIATGPTLKRALWLAGEVETLARQYILARGFGAPRLLPEDEIARVVEKFKSYGPRAKSSLKVAAHKQPSKRVAKKPAAKKATAKKSGPAPRRGGRRR
jgi:L-fuculose-phosphate aldolase